MTNLLVRRRNALVYGKVVAGVKFYKKNIEESKVFLRLINSNLPLIYNKEK